jgi:cholesterol transport system auxiliary component
MKTIARPSPRPSRRDVLVIGGATALLGGCGTIFGPLPSQLYVLTPKTSWDANLPTARAQLLVSVPDAPQSLDTQRIALSRGPTTVDYFANSAWTDRAPLMIQGLLVESFENTGKVVAVGRDTAGLRADYLIQTELRDFEARYYTGTDRPPLVYVRMEAKLVKMPEREIVSSLGIVETADAQRNEIEEIIVAFNEATGNTMKRVVQWVLRSTAETPRARAS